jgi:hypothetical protein
VGALRNASIVSLLALLVSVTPMVAGMAFALWPSERRLALMRPLSLAGIFAAVANVFLGLLNSLVWLSNQSASEPLRLGAAAPGLAETMAPPFVAFACLTVGWLCVAVGMRKPSHDGQ